VVGDDEVIERLGKIVLPGALVVGDHAYPRHPVGEECQREGVPSLIFADTPEPASLFHERLEDLPRLALLTGTVRENPRQPLRRVAEPSSNTGG
jgi:hypothetical protein